MRVKRWILLLAFGIALIGAGVSLSLGLEIFIALQRAVIRPIALLLGAVPRAVSIGLGVFALVGGALCVALGLRQTIRSLMDMVLPEGPDRLAEIVYQQRQLRRGPRIVVVGGGTGLATLLRGLKEYTNNVTAVVTMADDGGSSGRLRDELGIPPPGDIRNTLVALADTEPLMERLFQYRFSWGNGLKGHSFGNLFIAAMTDITGDFEMAVRESSKVLAIRGRVLPSTLESVSLIAEFEDGSIVKGESAIAAQGKPIKKIRLSPEKAAAHKQAVEAIEKADAIILGPGSLYTSIIPNLLVDGLADAIRRAKGTKIYVCNVMTQPGETDGLRASDHVRRLIEHTGQGVLDFCLINRAEPAPDIVRKYAREGSYPVECDPEAIRDLGVEPVLEDLIDQIDLARHDPTKLASVVMEILSRTYPAFNWFESGIKRGERL